MSAHPLDTGRRAGAATVAAGLDRAGRAGAVAAQVHRRSGGPRRRAALRRHDRRCGAAVGSTGGHFKVGGLDYYAIAALIAAVWLVLLASTHSYDARYLGIGSDEFRRVADAAIRVTALVAFVTFVGKLPLSRGFVALALPIGLLSTLAGRYIARRVLHGCGAGRTACIACWSSARRWPPRNSPKVSVARSTPAITSQVRGRPLRLTLRDLMTARERGRVLEVLARTQADTVAVAPSGFSPAALRELAWQLEGTGVDLLVSPALTDVAGPRIHMRPVDGLPLLHVEEPTLDGGKQLAKSAFDRVAALLLLVASSPVLLGIAVAIRLTSSGPAIFRQQRSGRGGALFTIYKFRTMRADADQSFDALVAAHAEKPGGMFVKDAADHRVTAVGQLLAALLTRRVAATLQRVAGADVACRTAAVAGVRRAGRPRRQPSAAGAAGDDGAVASQRSLGSAVRRVDPARPVLRRELVASLRPDDFVEDRPRRAARQRCLLTSLRNRAGSTCSVSASVRSRSMVQSPRSCAGSRTASGTTSA